MACQKARKKKLFEKTKQVSEPEADMAWMLELSVK